MNLPSHSTEALAEATEKHLIDLGAEVTSALNSHRGALAFMSRILMIIVSAGKGDAQELIKTLDRIGPPTNWDQDDPRRSGWTAAKQNLIDDLKLHSP